MVDMEGTQEPVLVALSPVAPVGGASFTLTLPLPAVALVQLCAQPGVVPAAPTLLTLLPIQGGNATVPHPCALVTPIQPTLSVSLG